MRMATTAATASRKKTSLRWRAKKPSGVSVREWGCSKCPPRTTLVRVSMIPDRRRRLTVVSRHPSSFRPPHIRPHPQKGCHRAGKRSQETRQDRPVHPRLVCPSRRRGGAPEGTTTLLLATRPLSLYISVALSSLYPILCLCGRFEPVRPVRAVVSIDH